MPFVQISFLARDSEVPGIETVLEDLGAMSVSYLDPGGPPVLEPGVGQAPLWRQAKVNALFEHGTDPVPLLAAVHSALGASPEQWHAEILEDRCWERAWMDDFHPMRFGRRLWVCPTNVEPPDPKAVNLRLDPGLAFGTGTHATTAMCLEWLDRIDPAGQRVLDFGCGSGVLAIAALLLGAEEAVGVDNDPQALTASAENAERNGVAQRLSLHGADGGASWQADILVANILAGTLIDLAPVLIAAVRPGGVMALSGILADQAEAVRQAYGDAVAWGEPAQKGGWIMLHGTRC